MTMTNTLNDAEIRKVTRSLEKKLVPFMDRFPGSAGERQPVHSVYGGAQLFKSDTTVKLGEVALKFLAEYGGDAQTFARAIGIREGDIAAKVYPRVLEKLKREP